MACSCNVGLTYLCVSKKDSASSLRGGVKCLTCTQTVTAIFMSPLKRWHKFRYDFGVWPCTHVLHPVLKGIVPQHISVCSRDLRPPQSQQM